MGVSEIEQIHKFVHLLISELFPGFHHVRVSVNPNDSPTRVQIWVSPEEAKKITGPNGKTIVAIRTVVAAMGKKLNTEIEVNLEIHDRGMPA